MRLQELEQFSSIIIQMHDNPDADALGSGYALYKYLTSKRIHTRLIYSGRYKIQKSNLTLFVEQLHIPVEYVADMRTEEKDLLLLVDCQYGGGNVTKIKAHNIAVIDHHQIEQEDFTVNLSEVHPDMGSCATVIWRMLRRTDYPVKEDIEMGTALYYALYMDTNQFAELINPLDRDMSETLVYDKALVNQLKHANISLQELEIAGIALLKTIYNQDYHYAVLQAKPCDPNLLGLISDFVIQVDTINTCVVYNATEEGFKFSVRSCNREVKANELAQFLAQKMGSGGGHTEKAGGFISRRLYEKTCPGIHSENYFGRRVIEYYEDFDLIDFRNYRIDVSSMDEYCKRDIPFGYIRLDRFMKVGTPVTIRTLEGDRNITVKPDSYFMVGMKGDVYPISPQQFREEYREEDANYTLSAAFYTPQIKNRATGETFEMLDMARTCYVKKDIIILARKLTKNVKVFTNWLEDSYMLGKVGDYLVVKKDSLQDIYVIEQDIFHKIYQQN